MNRRDFLGLLGKGALVVGAGGIIIPAAKKVWQVPVQLKIDKSFMWYKPRQFEDILQSTIQTVRDNYGQPTDTYLSSKDFADLEQELEEEWSGYDGLGRLLKEPVVVHKPSALGCQTYDLMKRMHNSLYPPLKTESLVTALKHVSFEPDNIKLWSSNSKA